MTVSSSTVGGLVGGGTVGGRSLGLPLGLAQPIVQRLSCTDVSVPLDVLRTCETAKKLKDNPSLGIDNPTVGSANFFSDFCC